MGHPSRLRAKHLNQGAAGEVVSIASWRGTGMNEGGQVAAVCISCVSYTPNVLEHKISYRIISCVPYTAFMTYLYCSGGGLLGALRTLGASRSPEQSGSGEVTPPATTVVHATSTVDIHGVQVSSPALWQHMLFVEPSVRMRRLSDIVLNCATPLGPQCQALKHPCAS